MEKNRLEVFEMWCFRKMLKTPWTERVIYEEVLDKTSDSYGKKFNPEEIK